MEWEYVASASGQFPLVEVELLNSSITDIWSTFSSPSHNAINPFMTSLSAVQQREYDDQEKSCSSVKAHSNLICSRGSPPEGKA